jgi:hypothetical protein
MLVGGQPVSNRGCPDVEYLPIGVNSSGPRLLEGSKKVEEQRCEQEASPERPIFLKEVNPRARAANEDGGSDQIVCTDAGMSGLRGAEE